MQSLILPPAPFITTPQFGLPRFNSGPDRLPLNRSRSTNARGYSPRALPPPRPMSGSIPAEDPLEISGHARRPGHPELPQPVTTTTGVSSSVAASTPTTVSTQERQPPPFTLHHEPTTSSRWPAPFGLHGVSQGPEVSYPPPPLPMASPPEAMSRNLPQKQTRRTKAHVASACVNCKKKHLGCDPARPCRRCVLSGKAATCVDVTHKKRGRPPLKAEDTSLRPYGTRMDQSSISGDPQSSQSSRRTLHRTTGSREIRPVTDLQLPGAHPGALGLRTGPPHRWSTSVFPPQAVDPSLTMPGSLGHRRFSSSGSIQSLPAAPPPPFVPMAGGLSPVFGSNRMPPVMGRPPSSYASQPLQPQSTSSPPYQQFYGESPYMSRAPMGESPISRDPQESSYLESPVRLPPIFPPMPTTTTETTSPTGHRLSDPYPYTTGANWSPRTREEQILPQERRPPVVTPAHTQPGLMEPVSPQTQIYQPHHHHHHHHLPPASEFSYTHTHTHTHTQPLPRPPESITPAHRHSIHLPSSTHARDEAPFGAEAEGGDGRPTKRRKMALDDMVND